MTTPRRLLLGLLPLLAALALVAILWPRRGSPPGTGGLPARLILDEPAQGAVSFLAFSGASSLLLRVDLGGRTLWLRSVDDGATFAPFSPPEGEPPPLPADLAPPPQGNAALRLPSGWVRVGRDAQGRGVLLPGGAGDPRREAPPGELVGAFQEGGPRLLLKRQGRTGFVDLVLVSAPEQGAPWGPESTTTVAYVKELSIPPGEERSCGLPDERYASLVGVGGKDAALIAVGPKEIHAYRFHATAGARYSVLCGSCPPMVLEARPDGLGIFVPIRRNLSPTKIEGSAGFEAGRSDRSASGSCTASRLAVIYEAGGKLLLQEREQGSWRFAPPRVVAETDARGEPTEPALLGVGDALIAVWRRKTEGRALIEALRL